VDSNIPLSASRTQKTSDQNTFDPSFWPEMDDSKRATTATRESTTLDSPGSVGRGSPGPVSVGPVPVSRGVTFFALAAVGATADLWSKAAIFRWRGLPGQNSVWWIAEDHFGIQTAVNTGAVFGLGAGKGTWFAVLSVLAGIGVLVWLFWFGAAHSRWLTWALGLISGGIIGNLYDRLGMWWQEGYPPEWQSGVRDWILFKIEGVPFFDPWPNFNIADSLLVVGACMLMYQSLFLTPKEES
jgi:signal peptidase II